MGISLEGDFSAIFHAQLCERAFARNDGVAFVDFESFDGIAFLLVFFDDDDVTGDELEAACCGQSELGAHQRQREEQRR